MFRLIRGLLRLIIGVAVLVAMVFGGLDLYFRTADHVGSQVLAAVRNKVRADHVHTLAYADIPAAFREAVVATEDRRFAWDPGIDPIGIVRSLIIDVEKDGYVEGGSTLTQQVVDNTIITHKKSLHRKLVQAIDAIGVYDTLNKQTVFDVYANVVYFGAGAYGLYNAAETYFGRTPAALNKGELTLLAGLPNAPSLYDPFQSLPLARARQHIVLDNMVDNGSLTANQVQTIWHEPIRLRKP